MMCGKDGTLTKCNSRFKNCKGLFAHVVRLWTHVVDNKKQATTGLRKKTTDDVQ
jgi:hypothetical protein